MEVLLKSRKSTCWPGKCLKVTSRKCKTPSRACSSASIAGVAPDCTCRHGAPIYLEPGGGAKGISVQQLHGKSVCLGWAKWKLSSATGYVGSPVQVEGSWLSSDGWWGLWRMSCATYCFCCFCCSFSVYLIYNISALSSVQFSIIFSGGIP